MTLPVDPHPEWEVPPPPYLSAILNQRYHYVSKGSQSFVFESEDGQWVLKFFRLNRWLHRPHKYTLFLHTMRSVFLAYQSLRSYSALEYIHLTTTDHLHQTLRLYDRLQRPYVCNADSTIFLIQKKIQPLIECFDSQSPTPITEQLNYIFQAQNLIALRCALGIGDQDAVIQKNMGVLDGQVVFLDVGSFYEDPSLQDSSATGNEVNHVMRNFQSWIDIHYPLLSLNNTNELFLSMSS